MRCKRVVLLLALSLVLLLTGCKEQKSNSSTYSNYNNYNNPSTSNNTNYFSQLRFGKPSIKDGKINDTVYVTVTNNSTVTLIGSIKAYIQYYGQVVESAVLYLPNDGLLPGDTATIDGIFNTVNGKWTDVSFQASTLRKK